jgi:hypothetical protein
MAGLDFNFHEAAEKNPVQNPATKRMIPPRASHAGRPEIPAPLPPANASANFPFSPRARAWLLGLLLVAATIAAYQPLWHAGFIWDDDDYVTNNTALHNLDGLKRIWFDTTAPPQYYPPVITS